MCSDETKEEEGLGESEHGQRGQQDEEEGGIPKEVVGGREHEEAPSEDETALLG